jgi:hypothetical protein
MAIELKQIAVNGGAGRRLPRWPKSRRAEGTFTLLAVAFG